MKGHERLIGRNHGHGHILYYTIKLVHCINVKVNMNNMNNEYVYLYRRISLYPYRMPPCFGGQINGTQNNAYPEES